ncbi:MAG TPA: CsbD family protein [Acidimicrobiales bacterium]|jgi:uncharacterized protein YjbJ (UPF0337 family)
MSNETEDFKGRAKEAVGDLTGNDRLRREGKTDRAAANVKDKVEGAVGKAEDAVDAVKDRVQDTLHRK